MQAQEITLLNDWSQIVLNFTSDCAGLAVDTFGGIDNDSMLFRITFTHQ